MRKMCNCKEEFCNQILKIMPNAESAIIANTELLSGRTYSMAKVTVNGRKKPIEQLILNSYCPFCGKPYKESEVSE